MATTRWNPDQADRDRRNPDNSSDIIDIQEETQAWIDNLKQSTIDSSINSAWTRSDLTIQQKWLEYERDMHSLVWFLSVLDKLLEEIEDTKKWISKKWLSKAWKKTMEEAKAKLNQYEKQLKGKKKTLLKQKRAEIYDNDISNLRNLWNQVNKVREDIWMWQRGEFSSTASYLYNSPEVANKSNKRQMDNLKFNQKLQKELEDGAILSMFGWSEQLARNYYTRVNQWEYSEEDYQFYTNNSSMLTPSFQRCGINAPTNPKRTSWVRSAWWNWWIERTSGTVRRSTDYSNMDWWDTFQKWWLAWLLDKALSNCSNMTPWQKETWKTLWVLGCFAWGIFWLYKFFTNKKMGFWSKAWITGLTIFWSQALTWEWPISLFNKLITWWFSANELKDKFGNAIWWLSSSWSESAEITVPAMQSMMIFNSWATAGEVQQMTQTFRRSNRNRRTFYNQSCDKIRNEYWEPAMQSFQSTFSDDFDEEKWKNWLASFGVTWSTDNKETIHELANNAHMNKTALEKFLADNKLKITTDSTKKAELDSYIRSKNEKNESIDLNELKAHSNDRFTKENPWNPQQPPKDKTPDTNPEIQTENKIDEALKNGLDKIYSHFEPKIKKINKVPLMKDIKKSDITKRFPELTKAIKSEFITIENNNVTINIDEAKMANIFDNFLSKLRGPNSTAPNYVKNALANKSWNSLKTQLNEYKSKNNKTKYNNMKENFTVIFNNIFVPIDSTIRSQNISPKIICNWQNFNNINDAINSMNIFK